MNTKLNPAVSGIILVAAIAAIATVMWIGVNGKPPPMPTGPLGVSGQPSRANGAGTARRGAGQEPPGTPAPKP